MSGISAQYVDGLEIMIAELREQVEKLTEERDNLRSRRCEVCGYLEHESEHTGCLREQLAALAEQVAALKSHVVMRFDHDVPPQFSQGYQEHEFLEPVTAEHCKWFVGEITALREQVATLKEVIQLSEDCALMDQLLKAEREIEKLTKERDQYAHRKDQIQRELADFRATAVENYSVKVVPFQERISSLEDQLAVLAGQNEKMKDALKTVVDDAEECTDHDDWTAMLLSLDAYHIASTCIEEINELPNLASPVLNRIRAEGMRMAAEICEQVQVILPGHHQFTGLNVQHDCVKAIRARADELEKGK